MDDKLLRVSVVGLGKLGYPLAACFAAKGHRVIGVDLDRRTVDTIHRGLPPVYEPGGQKLLQGAESRFKAILDAREAGSGLRCNPGRRTYPQRGRWDVF